MTDPPSDLVERSTRIVLRPIANPLPVGFLALAAGSFLVSALQLQWFEPVEASRVALFLIGFVAPLQLLAAIFGYLGRDIVARTGMAILAGTWLITGLILQDLPPGGTSDVLGAILLMSAIAMLLPAAAASGAKLVPALVISTTATRFALTGVYEIFASDAWRVSAAIVGLMLSAAATYAAAALISEETGGPFLPLGRRGRGAASLRGNLGAQLSRIEHEPGVREQL